VDPLRRPTAAQKFAFARQLRANPTPAERFAWSLLRNRGILGLKFRRQHVLHGFVVDFCCLERRIVLELDGHAHHLPQYCGYDAARSAILGAAGFRVLRLANNDVSRQNLERLLRSALENLPFVPPLPKGEGDRG
jgi:5-methyltetrahydrofolate--homocysteine methyltransferase